MLKLKKRGGTIAIGLLVAVALAFSLATLYAIITFKADLNIQTQDLSKLMYLTEFNKQYSIAETKVIVLNALEKCVFCTDSESLTESLKLSSQEQESYILQEKIGNLLGKIRNYEFLFFVNPEGNYQLEIRDVFITARVENNKVTRSFDICLIFDPEGSFLKNCEIQ